MKRHKFIAVSRNAYEIFKHLDLVGCISEQTLSAERYSIHFISFWPYEKLRVVPRPN